MTAPNSPPPKIDAGRPKAGREVRILVKPEGETIATLIRTATAVLLIGGGIFASASDRSRNSKIGLAVIVAGSFLAALAIRRKSRPFESPLVKLPLYLGFLALAVAAGLWIFGGQDPAMRLGLSALLVVGLSLLIWRPNIGAAGFALLVFAVLFGVVYGFYYAQNPSTFVAISSTATTGCSVAVQATASPAARPIVSPTANAVQINVTYTGAMQANDSDAVIVSLARNVPATLPTLTSAKATAQKRTSVALTAVPTKAATAARALKRTSVALTAVLKNGSKVSTVLERTSVALTSTASPRSTSTPAPARNVPATLPSPTPAKATIERAVKRTSTVLTRVRTKAAKAATTLKRTLTALTAVPAKAATAARALKRTSVALTSTASAVLHNCHRTPTPTPSPQSTQPVQATPNAVGTPGNYLFGMPPSNPPPGTGTPGPSRAHRTPTPAPTPIAGYDSTAFGVGYVVSATAALHAVEFKSVPLNEASQSVMERQTTWGWTVTPRSAGHQVISLEVDAVWTCVQAQRCGDKRIKRRIWFEPLQVEVRPLPFFAQVTPSLLLPFLIPAVGALLVALVPLLNKIGA